MSAVSVAIGEIVGAQIHALESFATVTRRASRGGSD